MATGNSNVPYQKIKEGSVSIQSEYEPTKKEILQDAERKRLAREKKNTWCCIHFRLPVTGRLEKGTLTWILLVVLLDLAANICLFMTNHQWWDDVGGHLLEFSFI